MDSLLYYPYINIPKSDWTARALLYYDQVGSIVPLEYFYDPERHFNGYMLKLVRERLVIPLNPVENLDNPFTFTHPLFDFFEGENFDLDKKRKAFQNQNSNQKSRIHRDKFAHKILRQLEELGIAKQTQGNWYEVESTAANCLMAYLATSMGKKLNMQPSSDQISNINFLDKLDYSIREHEEKRKIILNDLIPYPAEIDLFKLQKFKENNLEELKDFRNTIEQIVLDPTYDNTKLLKEKIKELKYRRTQLYAKMNESKFNKIVFGSVCGLIGGSIGLVQSSAEGAILGALPGFFNAIYSALQIESIEDTIDQSGMKYLALVDQKIGNTTIKTNKHLSFNF